uniref:Uncharacterized protein n=1 Tax=Anguilla anguilla TaxID=7936 RepID=A0A0E9PMI6_ANGAN
MKEMTTDYHSTDDIVQHHLVRSQISAQNWLTVYNSLCCHSPNVK